MKQSLIDCYQFITFGFFQLITFGQGLTVFSNMIICAHYLLLLRVPFAICPKVLGHVGKGSREKFKGSKRTNIFKNINKLKTTNYLGGPLLKINIFNIISIIIIVINNIYH